MKRGMIFDIKRYTIHDGPGIRTTIFFKGCPLKCQWCHTPESMLKKPETMVREDGYCQIIGKEMTVQEVMNEIQKDIIFFDESGGGVTFSGGEPTFQPKFLNELLKGCKGLEIHTALDTSGYCPYRVLETIQDKVDLFLYDIKAFNADIHKQYTYVSNELILENLRKLVLIHNNIIIRIPVIHGVNDDTVSVEGIADFLLPLKTVRRIDLLPYHNWGLDKLKLLNQPGRVMKKFPEENSIDKMIKIFEKKGFTVQVGG